MPTYEFLCAGCGHYETRFMPISSTTEEKTNLLCKCGEKKLSQTFTSCVGHIIAENDDPVSTKPSTYWRNAEANHQKGIQKREAENQEKNFYKDKETGKKNANKIRNSRNLD